MSNTIEAEVGITKNLGNFESLRLGARESYDLSPGEDKVEAWNALWKSIQDQIEAQLLEASQVVK